MWTLSGKILSEDRWRCGGGGKYIITSASKIIPCFAEIKQHGFSDTHPELSNQDLDSGGKRLHFPPIYLFIFYVASRFALFLITELVWAAPSNSIPLRSL